MKRLLILGVLLVLLPLAYGLMRVVHAKTNTAPKIEWAKCYGGRGNDQARAIKQTSDGGYIFAGYTDSNDGDVSGNHGYIDAWIVKLNSAGDIEWQKCLGSSGADFARDIQQTSDGGYIVAGSTPYADDVSGNQGRPYAWIVKLNATGDVEWQKRFGGSAWDYAYSVQQTSDGGYVFAGSTSSDDRDLSSNHGRIGAWIVKLDASGGIEWQRCFGGTMFDKAYAIRQTSEGGYVFSGGTSRYVRGNRDGSHAWVVKLNLFGEMEWQKRLGGSGLAYANSIQQTSDGGYVFAGSTYSSERGNAWVVKLNSFGETQWEKRFNGSSHKEAYSIQQTRDGGYILAGYTNSKSENFSIWRMLLWVVFGMKGNNNHTCWIVKMNTSGGVEWEKHFGGSGYEEAHSIQQTSDGGYIFAGSTNSNDGDVSGYGYRLGPDAWIVKLAPEGR